MELQKVLIFRFLFILNAIFLSTTEAFEVDTCSLADDSFFKETRGVHLRARDNETTEVVNNYHECISLCHQTKCFHCSYYETDSGENRCDIFRFGLQSPNGRIVYDEQRSHGSSSNALYLERIPCNSNPRMRRPRFIKKTHDATFCDELQKFGQTESGLYEVKTSVPLYKYSNKSTEEFQRVSCEMSLFGGGWTVVQQNLDGFPTTKSWLDYKFGFGDLSGTFWLGNEALHRLTQNKNTELLVQLEGKNDKKYFALFKEFWIDGEKDSYKLKIAKAERDRTLELDTNQFTVHNGKEFAVPASGGHAGWWYNGKNYDTKVFLNGNPDNPINWKRIVWSDPFGTSSSEKYFPFESSVMFVRRNMKKKNIKKKKIKKKKIKKPK